MCVGAGLREDERWFFFSFFFYKIDPGVLVKGRGI